jgi:four helix bundle protein
MLGHSIVPIARHFTELIIWQLADELRGHVFALTKTHPFAGDFKLRSQLDDAADSVCRNIAEGFGCKTDKEFARFVRIGRRSLNEVQDCFRSALLKQHVTEADLSPSRRLMRRLYPAISSFLRKLDPPPPPGLDRRA